MRNLFLRLSVAVVTAVGLVSALAGVASAQTTTTVDPVNSAFTSGQSSMSGYIAAGIGVIVAVLLLGLGVGLLVKYLRKAVRAA